MKVPDEIKSLAKESAPAQRLVSLLANAPEEQLFQDIVQCIVDIVRESPLDKGTKHGSNGVTGGISGEGKGGSRCDFSHTDSFVEQLTFLHPRYCCHRCLQTLYAESTRSHTVMIAGESKGSAF